MMKYCQKFMSTIYWIINSISFFIVIGLSILNLYYTSYVAYDLSEVVTITRAFPTLAFLIALLLILVFYFLFHYADKLPQEKYILAIFSLIYVIAGIYFIIHVDSALRDDALSVHNAAIEFSQGNYSQLLTGGYIFRKVHQLGLVSFERIIGLISFNEKFLFIINLIVVNGINYLTFKLCDLIFAHNKTINLFTIVLSYMFLPQFFFILFAYGLVVGFFFFLLAIYKMEQYFKTGRKLHLIIMLLSIVLAVLLKSNYLIGAITITCCFILRALHQKKGGYLALALVSLILPILATNTLNTYYEIESGIEIQGEEPKIMYVAMGINPMNKWQRGPGWYDSSNWVWYEQAGYDAEIATEKAKECIRNCLILYREHPISTFRFFRDKLASLWCEPMYQSVWSGPLESAGQQTHTSFLQDLYNGGLIEDHICLFMKAYLILILTMASIYFFLQKNKNGHTDYILIYLIGGFLFHVIWEAKSQYVYTYVFSLIPICSYSMFQLFSRMKQLRKN